MGTGADVIVDADIDIDISVAQDGLCYFLFFLH